MVYIYNICPYCFQGCPRHIKRKTMKTNKRKKIEYLYIMSEEVWRQCIRQKMETAVETTAIFSASFFLCLLLFGFVKLAFGGVLAGIGAALSIVIAFEEVAGLVLFFY
jgi:hypothetical protein